MSPFTPALRLHDRYVLRERIGLGGMSEVWRADDEVLGRSVAVKALAAQLAADPQLRATIQREARAAARLTHPNVTQVYDYGEATLPGGEVVPYLVMELVDGQNLADRLAAGPLPWREAVRTAGQVASALAAAHRIGVVHRDVKPGNVMLTETGAKVLDFGIATLAGPHHPLAGQTGELLMGTPAYVAPERLSAGPPDPASDVYALGALLYRTLTGRAPLPVQTWEDAVEVHQRHSPVPPPRVPGLPADLADLIVACLAADPSRRPTAAQLATLLRTDAAEPPTEVRAAPADPATVALRPRPAGRATVASAQAPTLIERRPVAPRHPVPAPRRRSRSPLTAIAAAALVLVFAVGVLLALDDDRGNPSAAGTANATPHSPSSPAAPKPPSPSKSPPAATTEAPGPLDLRQLATEFVALLVKAQAQGQVDRRTADDLRDELTDLVRGKPKDRAKHVQKLRERVAEAAEREELSSGTADRLDDLLERVEVHVGRDNG
ncbi:serine/threonine-protein kinase [Micromonospora musae]|uniref:non-specific serine/threonine protein kinase n=1 Tax=Micromonospora musae TaxID=1894970 RepID=A0A3A9YBQ8_9ACTN|nr:serine/threonine-protein kinase [Micromonospora musae]RKN29166.1 serine/threonine protein kinase [Micromonospora musae]